MKFGKKTAKRSVLPLFILLFAIPLFFSCTGKVSVSLNNASEIEGDSVYAVMYNCSEYSLNRESAVVALNNGKVSSGTAEFVLEEEDKTTDGNWAPNGTEWEGTGGVNFDLYVYTDDNEDGDNEPATGAPGSSYITKSTPVSFTLKGDKIVALDFEKEMEEYTGGTFTVEAENVPDGRDLMVLLYLNHASRDDDDPLALGEAAVSGGSVEVTLKEFPKGEKTFYGIDTLMYDVYVFLDENGNGEPDPGEQTYNDAPYMYTQDGDMTLTVDGDADFEEI